MPSPDATKIRAGVIHNISVVSGCPESTITDEKRLLQDLQMATDSRRALASGFQSIAKTSNPNASVTKSDCGKLKTVKSAITLVIKQATPSSV